jgi:hypothetical protein
MAVSEGENEKDRQCGSSRGLWNGGASGLGPSLAACGARAFYFLPPSLSLAALCFYMHSHGVDPSEG